MPSILTVLIAYVRDFLHAEEGFAQLLEVTRPAVRRAEILKFLGLSQYMRGERHAAQRTFAQAKALDLD